MYVCMYVCTASMHTSRKVLSGLYTDDVQLLIIKNLLYDQCAYSPSNRYLNFYY